MYGVCMVLPPPCCYIVTLLVWFFCTQHTSFLVSSDYNTFCCMVFGRNNVHLVTLPHSPDPLWRIWDCCHMKRIISTCQSLGKFLEEHSVLSGVTVVLHFLLLHLETESLFGEKSDLIDDRCNNIILLQEIEIVCFTPDIPKYKHKLLFVILFFLLYPKNLLKK